MRWTPGLPLVIGGLAEWVLSICAVWLGYIEGAAVATILGLLFVVGGIAIDSKRIKRNLGEEKPQVTNPVAEGFAVGIDAARKILEKERQKAELEVIKSQEKREVIRLPNGKEVLIKLCYNDESGVWVVAVPEGLDILDKEHYKFDDYDEALKFYEAVKAGMKRVFEEVKKDRKVMELLRKRGVIRDDNAGHG